MIGPRYLKRKRILWEGLTSNPAMSDHRTNPQAAKRRLRPFRVSGGLDEMKVFVRLDGSKHMVQFFPVLAALLLCPWGTCEYCMQFLSVRFRDWDWDYLAGKKCGVFDGATMNMHKWTILDKWFFEWLVINVFCFIHSYVGTNAMIKCFHRCIPIFFAVFCCYQWDLYCYQYWCIYLHSAEFYISYGYGFPTNNWCMVFAEKTLLEKNTGCLFGMLGKFVCSHLNNQFVVRRIFERNNKQEMIFVDTFFWNHKITPTKMLVSSLGLFLGLGVY